MGQKRLATALGKSVSNESDIDLEISGPADEVEQTDTSVSEDEESSDDEFEAQGSSSDEDGEDDDDDEGDDDDDDERESEDGQNTEISQLENKYLKMRLNREQVMQKMRSDGTLEKAKHVHVDDLSSDDEVVYEVPRFVDSAHA